MTRRRKPYRTRAVEAERERCAELAWRTRIPHDVKAVIWNQACAAITYAIRNGAKGFAGPVK